MELNKKLSELRKSRGLTQQELAEALNVSRQTVSRWEVGTVVPTLDNLMYLSKLYGITLDHLVRDGEETAPVPLVHDSSKRYVRPKNFLPAGLGAILIVGVLTFCFHTQNLDAEGNGIMNIINSTRTSIYQPVWSAAAQIARSASDFAAQAKSYYGVSASGGGVPLISPLLKLSLDYNKGIRFLPV